MSIAGGMRTAPSGKPYKKKRLPAVSQYQLAVLTELEATGALTARQLSDIFNTIKHGEMERRLQGLVKRGYVEWRRPDEVSTLQYHITTLGKALLRKEA
jgi:DNA-binding MarR family transcriptional regulator